MQKTTSEKNPETDCSSPDEPAMPGVHPDPAGVHADTFDS
jgi:hypothetical protein